jgi:omega-6 fatty acid desaturase (delta-12 desaturase)
MTPTSQLLVATRPFAREQRWLSWWHLWTTLAVLALLIWVTCSEIAWFYRLPFSVLAGLTIIRLFVLYHDHQHGTILRGSWLANTIMTAYGLLALNPPSVWKRSHQHHHVNNCKGFGMNAGSYPLLTIDSYNKSSAWEQRSYAAQRHPLTIACGYLTIFLLGMCIAPLIANPRRHIDAALSIVCHGLLVAWVGYHAMDALWLAVLLPCAIASGLGAYLFYAQHNVPGIRLRTGADWDYVAAALHSSSYSQMGPVMRWFTGNIGYHHVHHLNSHIPFYRLPEAMGALTELQSPVTTSLKVCDVQACLRLKLWDPVSDRLVPWPQPAVSVIDAQLSTIAADDAGLNGRAA